jgi:hypothetical protein
MPGTKAQLEQMIGTVVDAFNAHQIGIIEQYFDANVTVYSVKDHRAYSPRHAALAYLQNQFNSDNPSMDKPDFSIGSSNPPTVWTSGDGNSAIVNGTTKWYDNNSPKPVGEKLTYSFTFVYGPPNPADSPRWLFSAVWAFAK